MIFYFSGTGNSEWVARQLARQLEEPVLSIPDALSGMDQSLFTVDASQRMGLVFPVYAWNAPEIVIRFAKRLSVHPGAYCFAVCTCGDEAGLSLQRLTRYLPLNCGYSVQMPNNYVVGFDVDPPEAARQKISAARTRVAQIGAELLTRKEGFDVHVGSLALLKSYPAAFFFRHFGTSDRLFRVEQSCVSCGLCQRACPVNNIQLVHGRPQWLHHCQQCLACLHRCPVRAIQYGGLTQKKGRYVFPSEQE